MSIITVCVSGASGQLKSLVYAILGLVSLPLQGGERNIVPSVHRSSGQKLTLQGEFPVAKAQTGPPNGVLTATQITHEQPEIRSMAKRWVRHHKGATGTATVHRSRLRPDACLRAVCCRRTAKTTTAPRPIPLHQRPSRASPTSTGVLAHRHRHEPCRQRRVVWDSAWKYRHACTAGFYFGCPPQATTLPQFLFSAACTRGWCGVCTQLLYESEACLLLLLVVVGSLAYGNRSASHLSHSPPLTLTLISLFLPLRISVSKHPCHVDGAFTGDAT